VAGTKREKAAQDPGITNAIIAEWMALEAEKAEGILTKALRKASRTALRWPIEAFKLREQGRDLTELPSVGPYLQKLILGWFAKPPEIAKPPPERRHFLTLTAAEAILKKAKLGQYNGDLQMHSQWSDGSATIRDMALAGIERGYQFIAITDHSKGLKIAGGMDESELLRQGREIDELNHELKSKNFRVLKSIEMNLNPRGEGDMIPESLKGLDIVIGSFHSRLRVQEDQTDRYLAALRNPNIHILGHPRGRIYNYRLGLRADWPRVFAEAAKLDKAVEVDSYADRQDLDTELLKVARNEGVKIAIDTDAHHPEQLDFVRLGLAAAAKVRFPPERIINFWPVAKLLQWARELNR
jgi:histidinol phosphatase-like PHP family hydrolase